jgi:thioredoxin-like negative regulator of GroEL
LVDLGRGDELGAATTQALIRDRWIEVAEQIGRGDYPGAADLYAEIGALPNEAYTRLRAAAQLLDGGRRGQADEQLRRSLAFWRSVGASRYVGEGESLLAASA